MLAVSLAACGGSEADNATAAAALPTASAADRAGSERPTTVPDDFVFTPNGFFHPSCVLEVAPNERVLKEGAIQRADGSKRSLPPCAHPHYDRLGRVMTNEVLTHQGEPTGPVPSGHVDNWVISAQNNVHGNLQRISAEWTVPSGSLFVGQVLYYFPGLTNGPDIMQPVLQYNQPGHTGWSIASWNCCTSGYTWHSSMVDVSIGDHLYGSVEGTVFCDAPSGCVQWSILTEDLTTGQSVTLDTEPFASGMQDAVGGALEAWDVDSCQQYSLTHSVTFSSIEVETAAGVFPTMSWAPHIMTALPQCGFAESSTASSVTLTVADNGVP